MTEESGQNGWLPRLLAPLAFFVAATVLVLIVHNALNAETGDSNGTTATRSAAAGEQRAGSPAGAGRREGKRFYRVRAGDTLEAIALRFDTTVDDLLQLNPEIDPNALTPGQRIRIG